MKALLFLMLFLITIVPASALSTNILSSYDSEETMIIKINGNIVQPIQDSQVIFKRNNVFVPLEYDVARVGQTWYVWAIAPSTAGNYTFILDNIVTSAGSGVQTEDYQKTFNVSPNRTEYNINPGTIIANSDFIVDVELLIDESVNIDVNFPSEQQLTIQPGINPLEFSINGKTTGEYTVEIGKYSLPAYITNSINSSVQVNQTTNSTNSSVQNQTQTNSTQTTNTTTTNQTTNSTNNTNATVNTPVMLVVEPLYIQRLLFKEAKSSTYTFIVTNPTNKSYKNVEILYNDSLMEAEDDEFDIKAGENYTFTIELGKYPGYDLKERIYINMTNFSVEIPFFIRYTENASDVATFYSELEKNLTTNTTRKRTTYQCSELGGVVCSTSSTCKGETLTSKEGSCCLGICEQPKSSSGSLWGWIIGIAAIGILVWLYMKYKKAAPSADIGGLTTGP